VVTAMVTTISMVANNILMCCRFYGYLEITTEFGASSYNSMIWRWIDNLEFRIEFGDATFTFGDCDFIWRLRSKLEIAILLREICGRCVPP